MSRWRLTYRLEQTSSPQYNDPIPMPHGGALVVTGRAARIAFVGAGNHATESLYPNIPLLPEFDLVAVCDLVEEKARYQARKYGALAFTDVARMLDQVRPQGVCVCGPPEMHYAVGLQVLQRGLPLFIEKPPAPTLPQAQELAAAAREHGTWGMVGFMKRFAPANVVAREYMADPSFGALSSISLIHGSGPYNDMRRMLLFNGIHLLDLGRFLAGEVRSVFAHGHSAGATIRAVSATFAFQSGAVGQLNMNSGHSWSDCVEMVYLSGQGSGIMIENSRSTEVLAPSRRFAQGEGLQLYRLEQPLLCVRQHGRMGGGGPLHSRLLRRAAALCPGGAGRRAARPHARGWRGQHAPYRLHPGKHCPRRASERLTM